jgi:3-phenylpropionate/trans-cinnamate dioxygenase ferredoxin reductase subunit
VPGPIVVAGASLAGLRVVEQLRRRGHEGPVTVVGEELHSPYDRPPLSKQVLRGADAGSVALRDAVALAALDVEFRLGRRAVAVDLTAAEVTLDDGCRLPYGDLVVATGSAARRLPFGQGLAGVHTLRTLDDALALRAELVRRPRVVVIGGGFIGCEVAASLRALDVPVTLVEGGPAPLAGPLGREGGELVARLHRAHDVDLRCGVGVAGLEGTGHVEGVLLADGTLLPADVVVVGIGGRPATDWLTGSGLDVTDGVACDEFGRAAQGVWAAGDVARWHNPLFGDRVRVEHWTTAGEQAGVVARNLLGGDGGALVAYTGVPYFWSDQYDTRIQFAGHRRPDEPLIPFPVGDIPGRHVALVERAGVLVGALAVNAPRELLRYRGLIAARAPFPAATAAVSGVPS